MIGSWHNNWPNNHTINNLYYHHLVQQVFSTIPSQYQQYPLQQYEPQFGSQSFSPQVPDWNQDKMTDTQHLMHRDFAPAPPVGFGTGMSRNQMIHTTFMGSTKDGPVTGNNKNKNKNKGTGTKRRPSSKASGIDKRRRTGRKKGGSR